MINLNCSKQVIFFTTFLTFSLNLDAGEAGILLSENKEALTPSKLPVEEILVTGTRIKGEKTLKLLPIKIVDNNTEILAGVTSVGDALQNQAISSGVQFNDSFTTLPTSHGLGASTVSLRGMGTTRSLVLMNGKRLVPSGVGGSVRVGNRWLGSWYI